MKKILLPIFVCMCVLLLGNAAAFASFQSGDGGAEISQIQTRLIALGYSINADGDYGPQTVAAVQAFQKDHGLAVDGVVGPATYRALMGRDIPVSRGGYSSIRRVIATSMQYQGVPYVFGGTSPSGFDCSGFMQFVFSSVGVCLPRMADEQYYVGRAVSYSNLQPGDMVFFSTYTDGVSHSGLYIGNGSFISATSSSGVAVESLSDGYWSSCYVGARRVL